MATATRSGRPEATTESATICSTSWPFIDVLGGRASVIGHSFGGLLVTIAAGLFPERFERIVAIEGSGGRIHRRRDATPGALREWIERTRGYERRMPRAYPSVEAAAERMRQVNPRLSRELSLHLARFATRAAGDSPDAGQPGEGGLVWKFDNWVDARPPVELRPEEAEAIWAEVRVPVLLLIGAESHQRGHQDPEDAGFFADGRALVIERAGHWPHHDRTLLVVDLIGRFLRGEEPTLPSAPAPRA